LLGSKADSAELLLFVEQELSAMEELYEELDTSSSPTNGGKSKGELSAQNKSRLAKKPKTANLPLILSINPPQPTKL
jgi:hypothetical protein